MSIDLDALEAIAKLAEGDTRAPLTKISKADMALVHATPATVILEMIALIRRQEKELIEAQERRSEPSAVRVTIVDERAPNTAYTGSAAPVLNMVDHRLRQILNPPAPFHGEKWAAADALYWLTGDQAFADQADGLAAESLARSANCQNYPGTLLPDVVVELREYASNPGYSHGDYADTMKRAAHVIESLRAMIFHVAAQTDTDKGGQNFCHLIDELILSWNTSEPDTEALRQRRIDARAALEVAIERDKP